MARRRPIRYPFAKLYVRLAKILAVAFLFVPVLVYAAELVLVDPPLVDSVDQISLEMGITALAFLAMGIVGAFLILVAADFMSSFLQIEENTNQTAAYLRRLVGIFEGARPGPPGPEAAPPGEAPAPAVQSPAAGAPPSA